MSRTKLISVTAVGLSAAAAARGQVLYTVTDLGTLGGETSRAHAVNNHGQVVGDAGTQPYDQEHAFLWEHGVMIDLGTLPSDDRSTARAINDDGVIVGDSYYQDPFSGVVLHKAVVWEGASCHVVGRLDTFLRQGRAVNRDGHVVGAEDQDRFRIPRAIISPAPHYVETWRYETLGGEESMANAVNDLNHAVGWSLTDTEATHAFLYRDQELLDLGTLGGAWSIAHDISNRGEVVGASENERGETRAFLYRDEVMTDIGTLPAATSMTALAVNEQSHVVGSAEVAGGGSRAFLWMEVPLDLNDLIPPGSGWVLERAEDINEAGQIVGTGTHHGVERAFLLTPIRDATILRQGPARPE